MGAKGVYTLDFLLSDEEIGLMKNHADTTDERLYVIGLLYTGMRVGEFLHLRRGWVNWERGMIFIPATQPCKCRECARRGLWKPKTTSGQRPISLMFPELRAVLEEYFGTHEAVMELTDHRMTVWRAIRKVAARAGLPGRKIFPHVFRGTYARKLVVAGFDAIRLKDAMGWKTIAMAEKYIKMTGDQLEKEMREKVNPVW
jgi:integrase